MLTVLQRLIDGKLTVGTTNEETRIRWVEKTLKNIPPGSVLLDAGAGEQQYKKFCNHLKYIAQDFAQYNGLGDGKGLQMGTWDQTKLDIISDIVSIPLKKSSVDAILCTEVFEHIPEPSLAIKEFQRLLKKDGLLIITAPFCSMTHFAPYHYSTGFNKYYYEHHLTANGFEILEITRNGNYFEYLAQEINRLPWMNEQHSRYKVSLFTRLQLRLILISLQMMSAANKTSEEIMCFGYHIKAKKK